MSQPPTTVRGRAASRVPKIGFGIPLIRGPARRAAGGPGRHARGAPRPPGPASGDDLKRDRAAGMRIAVRSRISRILSLRLWARIIPQTAPAAGMPRGALHPAARPGGARHGRPAVRRRLRLNRDNTHYEISTVRRAFRVPKSEPQLVV